MLLSVSKAHQPEGSIHFSVISRVNPTDPAIYLWKSDPCPFPCNPSSVDRNTFPLLLNVLDYIIRQGPESEPFPVIEPLRNQLRMYTAYLVELPSYPSVFNCLFLCLCLCTCVMEAPQHIRSSCLELLEPQTNDACNQASLRVVLQALSPSGKDDSVMRSMGLMITHRMMERVILPMKDESAMWERSARTPFTYSYSSSATTGFWKAKVYAPLLAMKVQRMSRSHVDKPEEAPVRDRALLCALRYQQAEATIQLRYNVNVTSSCVDVDVGVDNVRCVVTRLASSAVMKMHRAPCTERHFASRIVLHVSPDDPRSEVQIVSAGVSCHNPLNEQAAMQEAGENRWRRAVQQQGMSVGPKWKHAQLVEGGRGVFQWTLFDPTNAKEVAVEKPGRMAMLLPNAWFKRFPAAEGGVVFAHDKHPGKISWKLGTNMVGKAVKWKVSGQIFVTYLPHRYSTAYCETRSLEFHETVELTLAQTSP